VAKGTLAMTAGMSFRTLAQAIIFLIIARVLGISDYGAYAAVLALSSIFGCFNGWGTHVLMLRDVSRNPNNFAAAWGRTLAAIAISAPVIFTIYVAFALIMLPADLPFIVIILIGLGDLIFAPVGLSTVTAFQGHDLHARAALLSLVPVLPRLAGAIALIPLVIVLPDVMILKIWATLYAVAALAATLYAMNLVRKELRPAGKPDWICIWSSMREGLAFAFGGAALKVYADIDKVMLVQLATMEAAGAYSAGYRMAEMATVPVFSLLSAAMPRFFRAGEAGVPAAIAYAHRILLVPVAYSILAGFGLYLCADILPLLLGVTYADAVSSLRWLAWLPIVSLPRLLLQTLFMGGDRQSSAVKILAGGGLVNIALNLWLIPLWSWHGAAAATYAVEITMALAMAVIVYFSKAKVNKPSTEKMNT
jgi:O-antigen/teichoic acid export membrane protein